MKNLFLLIAICSTTYATMRPTPYELDGEPRPTLYASVEMGPGGTTYTIAPDGCYGGV